MVDEIDVKSKATSAGVGLTSWRDWLSVWAVGFAVFVVTTTEMAPVGLLPDIARDLDVSDGTAGVAVTAFGLIAGLLAPISTVFSSRFDRRTLLLTILSAFTVGNFLSAIAQNYWLFIVSRVITGIIHGLMWSIVAAVAIRLVHLKDGVRATAIAFSGISLALVLGVPFGSLLGNYGGWRSAFAALAILSGVSLVVVRLLLPRLPANEVIAASDFKSLIRSRALIAALAITLVAVVGNYAAYTYIAPFLISARGVDSVMIGPFLLLYGVAGVIGNFISGYALDRVGSAPKVLGSLGLIVTGSLVLLLVVASRYAVLIMLVAWGASYSGLPVALQTLVLHSGGENSQAATSVYVLVFNGSIAIGALLGGAAIDTKGPTAPILMGAAFCLLSVVVNLVLIRSAAKTPVVSRNA
jgi:predicted MFS family arabinose efflux permease